MGRWRSCRRTTSCSAGRAASAISAAASRRTSPTRARSPPRPRRSASAWRGRGSSGGSRSTSSWVRGPGDAWSPYAIELNLRKGGTTHPFLTLQFLTGGRYDPETALFVAPSGREKHLVATDHLTTPVFRGLTHDDLFDIAARHGLHFDQSCQAGVVFHMMTALSEFGTIGLTAVGDSAREADETYRRAERVLLAEAEQALVEPAVPVRRSSGRA
jgi:hypothetical protein